MSFKAKLYVLVIPFTHRVLPVKGLAPNWYIFNKVVCCQEGKEYFCKFLLKEF